MIDTQAIRNKILDLAMRGQLTRQLPEDGTGEELFQKIQAEKQVLIKAGKIKKEKPLSEIMGDEIPFKVPRNWKWVKLGDIGITVTGGTPAKAHPEYYGGSYPFFKPSDLDAGRHITQASEYLTHSGKVVSRQLQKGSILVCCIGSIGKSAIIDTDGTANQQINAIMPLVSESDYLLYSINSDVFQRQLEQGSRATTVSIINKSKFDNCIIPLPPLEEQKRIVDKIDQVFSVLDTIDLLQTQYADNLTALKAKLIDAAIQGKLTEQLLEDGTAEELYQQIQTEKQVLIKAGKIKKEKPLPKITADEISIEIPENWKSCRLGTIITLVSGTDYKPEEYNAEMRGTPYITGASNLLPEGVLINRWTETPRCIANDGDVLLVCKGSGYGKVAMCDVEEAHIARQIMAIKKTDLLDMRYILYYLTANFSYLKGKGQGLIPGVDRKSVLGMIFPLPPLAEQKRIAQKIDELLPLFEK